MALLTVHCFYTFYIPKANLNLLFYVLLIFNNWFSHYHVFKKFFQRLDHVDPQISELCRILVDKGSKYGFVSAQYICNFVFCFLLCQT